MNITILKVFKRFFKSASPDLHEMGTAEYRENRPSEPLPDGIEHGSHSRVRAAQEYGQPLTGLHGKEHLVVEGILNELPVPQQEKPGIDFFFRMDPGKIREKKHPGKNFPERDRQGGVTDPLPGEEGFVKVVAEIIVRTVPESILGGKEPLAGPEGEVPGDPAK
jgi:hypothetical protein